MSDVATEVVQETARIRIATVYYRSATFRVIRQNIDRIGA